MEIALLLIAVLVMFCFPAMVIGRKLFVGAKLPIVVVLGLGIGLWAFQSYLFGYLNMRYLSYGYILLFAVLFFRNFKFQIPPKYSLDWVLAIIVLAGVIIQSSFVISSGRSSPKGIYFDDINAYDGIYYLTTAKAAQKSFPPQEPGFWQHKIINYHYFSALVIADIGRIFGLSLIDLQFKTFPIFISILYGLLMYEFSLLLTKSNFVARLSTFLAYFGSDAGYVTSVVLLKTFSITNLQPIDTGSQLLTNMPRALSFVILLSGLYLLFATKTARQYFLSGTLLAVTAGFKVYTGTLGMALFLLKIEKRFIFILAIVLGILALVFLPTNKSAGGLFFAPIAWPRHWFASTQLQSLQWHLAEQIFIQHNNWKRVILVNIQYLLVFVFTILGTRSLGLFYWPNFLFWFVSVGMVLLSTFTLQYSGIYNTFNFISNAALFLCILTAQFINKFSGWKKLIFTSLIIVMTLPRPLSLLWQRKESYLISSNELTALNYIKDHTDKDAVILAGPNNSRDYYSPYVEFFSDRSTFLSNQFILESHNQPIKQRRDQVNTIFESISEKEFMDRAREAGVNFVYFKLPIESKLKFLLSQDNMWYKNNEVLVMKI